MEGYYFASTTLLYENGVDLTELYDLIDGENVIEGESGGVDGFWFKASVYADEDHDNIPDIMDTNVGGSISGSGGEIHG